MRALFALLLLLLPAPGLAQDKEVALYAPAELVETGLFQFALPRFSLKTQVRVRLVEDPGVADMVFGAQGTPMFEGAGAVWHMELRIATPAAERFASWLGSDVGKVTIFGFAPNGEPVFSAPSEKPVEVAVVAPAGDAGIGHQVARTRCARCHAVDEATRKTTIGSTPSFFVLRAFKDWEERFATFYVLAPHPAFTQIADVTPPFPDSRPSPIVPIELTLDELEAVLAYVARLEAADLGAPLIHQ